MATMRKAGGTKRKTKSGKSSEHTERRTPKSPMLAQHQQKAGLESKVTPRPRFEAPLYWGSGNYGYFDMARAALPHLKKGSSIIKGGSITGLEGSKELLDYSWTKGAIHAFTKSLAQNLVERGIRVNCVAPGPVSTPLNPSDKDSEDVREFGADTPMGRPAQPEEIAPAYAFFASESDSSYVTGDILTLLGGETTAG